MMQAISIQMAYIGLGSNLQNPQQQLQTALAALSQLPHSELVSCSPFYQTKPHGPVLQDDFINAVIALKTQLSPQVLLQACQAIESAQGRVREQHWGPRTLDLDILLYDDLILDTVTLTLPHPELKHRDFVLYPLADIALDLCLPTGESIQTLIQQLNQTRPQLLVNVNQAKAF